MKGTGGRSADNGDGWFAVSTRCRLASINPRLPCACAPHNMNTVGAACCDTWRITASVNASHPLPAWLAGCPSSTVRQVLSSRTPFSAQRTKLPPGCGWAGNGIPRSRCSSLKMPSPRPAPCRDTGLAPKSPPAPIPAASAATPATAGAEKSQPQRPGVATGKRASPARLSIQKKRRPRAAKPAQPANRPDWRRSTARPAQVLFDRLRQWTWHAHPAGTSAQYLFRQTGLPGPRPALVRA